MVNYMTERERLIQLIAEIKSYEYGGMAKVTNEGLADYLLDNGVVTLPCKLYDTVYLIVKGKAEIFEATVRRFSINQKCELIIVIEHKEDGWFKTGNYKWSSFGKWVFLNKKDAENALAGRNNVK